MTSEQSKQLTTATSAPVAARRRSRSGRIGGAALALALALAQTVACTIVVPPPPDDGKPKTVVVTVDPGKKPPPPDPLEAHALFVMNLQQSSANLASSYVTLAEALVGGLAARNINVVRWAVIPTYPGANGLGLLLGQQAPIDPGTLPPIPGFGGAGGAAVTDNGGYAGAGGYGGSSGIPYPPPTFDTAAPGTVPVGLPTDPTLPNGTDIVTTLQQIAASGEYDGLTPSSEAEGIVRTGANLVNARLPAELGGLDGAAFFDRPTSLFLVVYLQPLARHCSVDSSACAVDGRSPADIFTATEPDGTASWLHFASGGMPIGQVVHVALTTSEGESAGDFRRRCAAMNGFPTTFFDDMEPSPSAYFEPLLGALNAAHPGTGQTADLCSLMAEMAKSDVTSWTTMNGLVNQLAARAVAPPADPTSSTTGTTGLGIPTP